MPPQSPFKDETAHVAQPTTVSEAPARASTVLQASEAQNLSQALRGVCSGTSNHCSERLLQSQAGEQPNETSSLPALLLLGQSRAFPGGVTGVVLACWSLAMEYSHSKQSLRLQSPSFSRIPPILILPQNYPDFSPWRRRKGMWRRNSNL